MSPIITNDEEESCKKLNEMMHSFLGYHSEDSFLEAWSVISKDIFEKAVHVLDEFQKLHKNNFMAARWNLKIQKFTGSLSSSTQGPREERTVLPSLNKPLLETQGAEGVTDAPGPAISPLAPPLAAAVPLWRRYAHSLGGSSSIVPSRRTKPRTPAQLKINDLSRAVRKLGGMDAVIELRESWSKMETDFGGREWEQFEGVVIGLINQGLSQKEIRAVLPIGGFSCARLKKAVDTNFVDFHTKRGPATGSTAVNSTELQFFKNDVDGWVTEDGFPCAHRRPHKFLIEENITWKLLHHCYSKKAKNALERVISLGRWRQFIQFHSPGLRLSRVTEDVCDACVRLKTLLMSPNLSDQLREKLLLEKSMLIHAAVEQHHAMSDFVKLFVEKMAPNQALPDTILDCIDSNLYSLKRRGSAQPDLNASPIPTVVIQAEDYGGSIAMPHYGFKRPSADYFNNLMLHQFVSTNISEDTNQVIFYDEHGQGKGVDALCSMRMQNLLSLLEGYRARGSEVPQYLVNILDNCVGQNKSNAVMKFFAMVSILLFEKVVLLYLISGHSHMKADRVVAWCKGAIQGLNLYCPDQVANLCNEVKGVNAEFLDHCDPKRPFFSGWDTILNKYFKSMPIGFTSYYFFKFDAGIVTMKALGKLSWE